MAGHVACEFMLLLSSVPLLTQDLSQGRYDHSGQGSPHPISSIKIICGRHALRSTSWVTATSGRFIVHTTHYRQYNLCRLHLSEDARSRLGFCPFFFMSRGEWVTSWKWRLLQLQGEVYPAVLRDATSGAHSINCAKLNPSLHFPQKDPTEALLCPPHTHLYCRDKGGCESHPLPPPPPRNPWEDVWGCI